VSAPGHGRRRQHAWCLYDWANSAFATSIMAAVLPPYFVRVAAADLGAAEATALWGYATSGLLVLAAVVSPIVGALAGARGDARRPLALAVLAGATGSAALAFAGRGDWPLVLGAYGVAFLAFASATVLYDGLLPAVAGPAERDALSARGFAWGYAGGGLLLLVHAAWIAAPGRFGFADAAAASRAAYLTVGVWWALFSLPLLLTAPPLPSDFRSGLTHPWARLRRALRAQAGEREAWRFLLAFWLYSDVVGTVVKMATLYGAALGFGTAGLVGALLVVQFLGIPFTLLAGRWSRRVGARPVVLAGLGIYGAVLVFGYFLSEPWHFWALAALVATAQGAVQSLSRSLFSHLVPEASTGEMFGFFGVSEKLAGFFGPLLFATATQWTGSPRAGTLALLPLLVLGGWLLLRVRLPEPGPA
jgi:UMF1 family MFS transporter